MGFYYPTRPLTPVTPRPRGTSTPYSYILPLLLLLLLLLYNNSAIERDCTEVYAPNPLYTRKLPFDAK